MENDGDKTGLIPKHIPACPSCGKNKEVIPILYGLPNLDAIQLEAQGKLVLGSRFYRAEAPCWFCKKCGVSFSGTAA
jgi:hypothetical protein